MNSQAILYPLRPLFSYAEARKYLSKQVVSRDFAGNFGQCHLRQPKLFGKKLPALELSRRLLEMSPRPPHGAQVSLAREIHRLDRKSVV